MHPSSAAPALWQHIYTITECRFLSSAHRCTGIALGLSAASVATMKLPTIIEGGERGAACLGDLYAVAAGMGLGGLLTVNRSAALHAPKAKMIMAPIIGSTFCVIMAAALLSSRGLSPFPECGNPGATVAFIGLAAVRPAALEGLLSPRCTLLPAPPLRMPNGRRHARHPPPPSFESFFRVPCFSMSPDSLSP